jgi:uncharacterized protein YutE (UPF0331/DUF86 family)
VVLRPDAVRARLLKLEEIVSRLEEIVRLGRPALRKNPKDQWAAERGLQLGAEALLDVGNHVLSAHFGVTSEDYEDVVRQLAAHGVVPAELGSRLKGIGGFRNLLVHDYLRVDPERVLDNLEKAPRDLGDFVAAIRRWLESLGPSTAPKR